MKKIHSKHTVLPIRLPVLVLTVVALIFASGGCRDPYMGQMFELDEGDETKITNIAFMEKYPEDYSLFLDFLKAADYYNALNDASSTVTVFAPDNAAMDSFMKIKDISSFDQLDSAYARQVIQVHMLRGSLNEASFIQYLNEGSIGIPTLFGDYLTLSYGFTNRDIDDVDLANSKPEDTLSIYINNMASVRDIAHQTVNGMVYKLGGVIRPLIETVVEKMHDYGEYELFLEAIEQAGMTGLLNITSDTVQQAMGGYTVNPVNYTVLAVSDETFRSAGIQTMDDLENYLAEKDPAGQSGIARSDSNSVIRRYVSYHILAGANTKSSLTYSLTPNETKVFDTFQAHEIITIQTLVGQTFINRGSRDVCGFVRSDIKASNGYIHKIDGILPVWCPEPSVVVWDFCNSTDIVSIANSYGAANNLGNLYSTPSDAAEYKVDITKSNPYGTIHSFDYKLASTKGTWLRIGYWKCKANTDATLDYENEFNAHLNNLLILNLGYTGWIEFTTPTIVKGTYRVELYYAGAKALAKKFYGGGSAVKFTLDDFLKQHYLWKGWESSQQAVQGEVLFPNITFETTQSHSFKAVFMDANASTISTYRQMWDYVKFIPLAEE